jgi:hypothetical protein
MGTKDNCCMGVMLLRGINLTRLYEVNMPEMSAHILCAGQGRGWAFVPA